MTGPRADVFRRYEQALPYVLVRSHDFLLYSPQTLLTFLKGNQSHHLLLLVLCIHVYIYKICMCIYGYNMYFSHIHLYNNRFLQGFENKSLSIYIIRLDILWLEIGYIILCNTKLFIELGKCIS